MSKLDRIGERQAPATEGYYCTHDECRLEAIAELSFMNLKTGRGDLIVAIRKLKPGVEVRCRHIPKRSISGAPQAPLPPLPLP